ncbi:MAG: TIGR04086 family membrane protein [Bacillota bacterium]
MVAERTGRRKPERGGGPETHESGWFLAVVLGVVASIVAVIVLFLAIAVYDFFASPQAKTLSALASAGNYLATCAGGFVAGKKSGKRGLIFGGLVGLVFSASVLIAGAGGPASVPITAASLKRLVLSAVAGGVGGMFGVASS